MKKPKKRLLIWICSILTALAVVVGACYVYVADYYHTDRAAVDSFSYSASISKKNLDSDAIAYIPDNARAGLIFYPGGKVEYTAYEPLMLSLAEKGILSILVKMPCNLAVLDINAADGIQGRFTQIKDWYIGGHSLGGSMAASYAAKHTDDYKGLVLLAAYSTADISKTDLNVISIYGSEDKVLNAEKYDKYKPCLPPSAREFIIDGGCHAYFGMYGQQQGDGAPTISNIKQISITAEKISENIGK